MESKYYTPELKEFCLGLEYNFQSVEGNWILNVITESDLHVISDRAKFNPTRIKYLDREDIEELGWKSNLILVDTGEQDELLDGFDKQINKDSLLTLYRSIDCGIVITKKEYTSEVSQ